MSLTVHYADGETRPLNFVERMQAQEFRIAAPFAKSHGITRRKMEAIIARARVRGWDDAVAEFTQRLADSEPGIRAYITRRNRYDGTPAFSPEQQAKLFELAGIKP